jgi:hypothetical protein
VAVLNQGTVCVPTCVYKHWHAEYMLQHGMQHGKASLEYCADNQRPAMHTDGHRAAMMCVTWPTVNESIRTNTTSLVGTNAMHPDQRLLPVIVQTT